MKPAETVELRDRLHRWPGSTQRPIHVSSPPYRARRCSRDGVQTPSRGCSEMGSSPSCARGEQQRPATRKGSRDMPLPLLLWATSRSGGDHAGGDHARSREKRQRVASRTTHPLWNVSRGPADVGQPRPADCRIVPIQQSRQFGSGRSRLPELAQTRSAATGEAVHDRRSKTCLSPSVGESTKLIDLERDILLMAPGVRPIPLACHVLLPVELDPAWFGDLVPKPYRAARPLAIGERLLHREYAGGGASQPREAEGVLAQGGDDGLVGGRTAGLRGEQRNVRASL